MEYASRHSDTAQARPFREKVNEMALCVGIHLLTGEPRRGHQRGVRGRRERWNCEDMPRAPSKDQDWVTDMACEGENVGLENNKRDDRCKTDWRCMYLAAERL